MLNYLRQLAGRKSKTLRGTTPRSYSRSRQVCLMVERLGDRILLAAGSSISPVLSPTLDGGAVADNDPDRLVPVSSYIDDPFVRPAHVAWMNLADFDHDNASGSPTRLS